VVPEPSLKVHHPTRPDAVTVRVVEPLIEPEVASIVVLLTARPVAKPALVIVAAEGFKEVQVTEVVRF